MIESVSTNAANTAATDPARIWLSLIIRISPTLSATAPARMVNTIIGTRSENATMPSQPGEWVSSQVSQPTPVRFIQRPTAASVWPNR